MCLVAGGSGGHILPALELAKKWLSKNPTGRVVLVSNDNKLDKELTKNHAFLDAIIYFKIHKFSRKDFLLLPIVLWQFLRTFIKSFAIFRMYNPEIIVSTGGILAIPVCLAGWLKKKAIYLHELIIIPGKAVMFLAPIAKKIIITFDRTKWYLRRFGFNFAYKSEQQNYPVRFALSDKLYDREKLFERVNKLLCVLHGVHEHHDTNNHLFFEPHRKTLFLLGGSQGSVFLNNGLKSFWEAHSYLSQNIQIIHQTGSYDTTDWRAFYKERSIPAITFSYYDNVRYFYLISDLVICRAGAGTLFELLFFEKKSLVVPLVARTTDHQVDNAREMARVHPEIFTVFEQDHIVQNPLFFYDVIIRQLSLRSQESVVSTEKADYI